MIGPMPKARPTKPLSAGCVAAVDSRGRTIWIADAHRGDGQRFVVRADEKLTAFVELESAISKASESTAAAG
jgi:hypothetical protein